MMKLCHIMCERPSCVSADVGHFKHDYWWSRLVWHNFIKVADNWMKNCSPAWIGTHNRHVKFGLKTPSRLGKNVRKTQGGGIWLTLYTSVQSRDKDSVTMLRRLRTIASKTPAASIHTSSLPESWINAWPADVDTPNTYLQTESKSNYRHMTTVSRLHCESDGLNAFNQTNNDQQWSRFYCNRCTQAMPSQ